MAKSLITKHIIEAIVKPTLDKGEKEQLRSDLNRVFSEASNIDFNTSETRESLENLVKVFKTVFSSAGIQGIDFDDLIKMPSTEQFAKLGELAGKQFWDAWNSVAQGKMGTPATSMSGVAEQIQALEKRQLELNGQSKKLDNRLKRYEYLSEVSSMEMSEFKPLKVEDDIDEQAQRVMGEFVNAEDALNGLTRGTKEYNTALIKALDAASNLYRMSQTLNQNKGSVKDKTLLEDYSVTNLSDVTYDVFEKGDTDFGTYLRRFYKYYEAESKAIVAELGEIDAQMKSISQNNPGLIDEKKAEAALKTLEEIEAAYSRILNKNKSVNKVKSRNILSALEYTPGSESLATLSHGYTKSFDADENWENQYQWLVKFVREYEAYANGPDVDKERLNRYTSLYEQLKPMAANAEIALQNVLNMANKVPLTSIGGDGQIAPLSTDQEVDQDSVVIASQVADEAERKARAEQEAAEAQARREELLRQLDAYSGDVLDSQTARDNLDEREKILQQLRDENLLTEEIENNYNKINERLKARADLLFEAETRYDDIDDVLTGSRVDAIDSGDQYRKDHIRPLDNTISQMSDSGFFSEEELEKFEAVSNAMERRAQDLDAESDIGKLYDLEDETDNITDADKLNSILEERQQILLNLESYYDTRVYADEIEHHKAINTELEKRVALLREAQSGAIDVDDIDDILKENGTLDAKLERLGEVSYNWGMKIKDGDEDDAADELEEFEKTYDRIVLKLANGKNIEILPNAKGLRALHKYEDGLDPSAYGETEIDDIIFERVKKEANVAEQAVDDLNDSIEKTQQLNQGASAGGTGTGTGDASSEELRAAQEENESLREQLKTEQLARESTENALSAEMNATWDADQRAQEAEAENERLKQQLAEVQTASATVPDDTSTDTNIEETRMKGLQEAVEAVTTAVNLKTQAFEREDEVVKAIASNEVNALTPLKETLETISTLINNIRANNELGAGLSNIAINVNHADTQQNDLTAIVDAISKINISATPMTDVGNVLATENTLLAIKSVLDAINGKVKTGVSVKTTSTTSAITDASSGALTRPEQGVSGQTSKGGKDGSGGKNFNERVNTAATSLAKYTVTLQEANQLHGVVADGIDKLSNELKNVTNDKDLSVWKQHFAQFKNGSDIIKTLTKDYKALGIAQAKADMETNPFKQEQYLDDVQILQDRIAVKAVGVDTGDDRFEEARQRAYNITRHDIQQKQELINVNQVEAEITKRLIKLYEQLGRARSTGNMMEASRVRQLIAGERSQLGYVDYATDMKFKAARDKGFDSEEARAEKAELKEQESIVNNLVGLYRQLGDLKAKAENSEGGLATWYGDQAKSIESQIVALTQQLDLVTNEMQSKFDSAYATGKDSAENDILRKLYADEDATRKSDIKDLGKVYEQLGKAQARFAETGSLETEQEIGHLEQIIKAEKERLKLTSDQIAALETRRNIAATTEADALDVARREKTRKHYEAEETKARRQQAKQADADFKKAIRDSQQQAKTNKVKSVIGKADDTLAGAMSIDGLSDEQIKRLKEYNAQLTALKNKYNEVKTSDGVVSAEQQQELINQTRNVDIFTTEIKELVAEYQRLSGDNVKVIGTGTLGSDAGLDAYKKQLTEAVMAATNGQAQIKGFDAATKTLTYSVKTGSHEFTEYAASVRHLDNSLVSVQGTTKRTETFLEGIKRKTKEIFMYFGGSSVIYQVFGEIKKGIQYVREIDSALTELKKVTSETEETYERFLDTAAKTASKVGSTVKDVVSSTADWARLGYSIEEAARMAESTQILMNVSEFTDISSATDSLISSIQAFKYTAEESMDVVDILNTIGKQNCRGCIVIYDRVDNYNG